MLSIEYVHKRMKIFRVELSVIAVAILGILILLWQILSFLKIIK